MVERRPILVFDFSAGRVSLMTWDFWFALVSQ